MPDSQVKDMTELTSPSADDVLYVQANPTGTPVDRKITIASLRGGISSDTTLYVAAYGGSDTTGQGTSGSPWATLPKALDYLKDKWINDDVDVTIQLSYGVYTHTSQITIEHPCSSRIKIRGADLTSKTAINITYGVGPSRFDVTLNSDAPNSYTHALLVKPYATSGVEPFAAAGFWKVMSVDPFNLNSLTLYNTLYNVSYMPVSGTADVKLFTTVLQFNGCNGIVVKSGNSITLENLAIFGDSTASKVGIFAGDHGTLSAGYDEPGGNIICTDNTVGVYGFGSAGFAAIRGGTITAHYCGASNCGYGIYARAGKVSAYSGVFTGCTNDGCMATNNSTIYANNNISIGNNRYGFYSTDESYITCSNSIIKYNSSIGIHANNKSSILSQYCTISNNLSNSIVAYDSSDIDIAYSTFNSNGGGCRVTRNSNCYAYGAIASGNGSTGFIAEYNSTILADTSKSHGHTQYGYYCLYNSSMSIQYVQSSGNTTYQAAAFYNSFIDVSYSNLGLGVVCLVSSYNSIAYAYKIKASGSSAYDIYASNMSMLICQAYSGSPTFSPAVDVWGNNYSIIID